MQRSPPRTLAILAALGGAAALAFAYAVEVWGELPPGAENTVNQGGPEPSGSGARRKSKGAGR